MIRKQLYLDEDLDRALKRLSASTGKSEAQHVRDALRAYVDVHAPGSESDPLERLIGLLGDAEGADDVAAQHDRYLYDR
jgi:hypothetical protein